jgi:hypothetical protein
MALQRYWFIDRGQGSGNRLGIVEKSNSSSTKETITSNFASISEQKDIRIYTIDTQRPFEVGDVTVEKLEIPKRYHEALVYKVVSIGYQDARNQKIDMAQYFNLEYEKLVKKARKHARSSMQTHGFVQQVDF